jgi:hypothetical protein
LSDENDKAVGVLGFMDEFAITLPDARLAMLDNETTPLPKLVVMDVVPAPDMAPDNVIV